ncbi:MAG: type IV pilin-like G/H family protein [Spirulinaceae cyanobacterium]
MGQANKAKQAEARNNVGSLVRGQQAYYLENSGFTEDIDPLGLGLLTASANYGYVMQGIGAPTTTTPITKYGDIGVYGLPGGTGAAQSLKAYVGLLNTGQAVAGGSATTLAVVCESVNPIEGPLAPFGNGTLPNQAALRGTIGGMAASAPAAGAQPDCQLHMGTYPNPPAPAWKQLGA